MVCHHLNPSVPEDLAFAESRIRPSTIAAEDLLARHRCDLDDRQRRPGDGTDRRGGPAHLADRARDEEAPRCAATATVAADNNRVRRYVAKYTICPAIAHGFDHEIGSVEIGKLADLVLWEPAFFGVRPHAVIKGGMIAWAAMGDANASIPTPQPVLPRPMFGAAPAAAAATSVHFVAPQAIEDGLADRIAVKRRLVAVGDVRKVGKAEMPRNDAMPQHRSRPRHLHRAHRRRGVGGAAGHRTADGAAILPVLMSSCCVLHAAHPVRLPAADGRPRPLRRCRRGRDQRPGRRPADTAGLPAPPHPHARPGHRIGGRRRALGHAEPLPTPTAKPMRAHRLPRRAPHPGRRGGA